VRRFTFIREYLGIFYTIKSSKMKSKAKKRAGQSVDLYAEESDTELVEWFKNLKKNSLEKKTVEENKTRQSYKKTSLLRSSRTSPAVVRGEQKKTTLDESDSPESSLPSEPKRREIASTAKNRTASSTVSHQPKGHQCPECLKVLTAKSSLREHLRVHTGLLSFS
jgi:ribosomal protein S21